MNAEKLGIKLLAAARAEAPSNRVPYAFEKRITARLHSRSAVDSVALWSRALWRAAVPCVAVPMLLAFWATSSAQMSGADSDLSQAFEDTVYASVEQQIVDIEEW